ncbi:unnamed protein product [Gongylonema pulchrum]|uniref:Secreted protein n=1 Tax=Gongylonema pulchrum TaxID=637853 RepID=A0A183D7G4_9BILA|nr:unnamed protein product [Gongylonema pulchrum]
MIMTTIAVVVIFMKLDIRSCKTGQWTRATCANVTCSPHSVIPLFKEKVCGSTVHIQYSYCYVRTCDDWEATSRTCSITDPDEQEQTYLIRKPDTLDSDAVVTFRTC